MKAHNTNTIVSIEAIGFKEVPHIRYSPERKKSLFRKQREAFFYYPFGGGEFNLSERNAVNIDGVAFFKPHICIRFVDKTVKETYFDNFEDCQEEYFMLKSEFNLREIQ